ncbi:MAG: SAM-dependent methyltransferase [Actinomycetia bacterium]|nr:SAM-dependent methyltransferase [Actinomycetes bacterium]
MSPYISWLNAWESAAFGPDSFYGEFGKGGSNPYNHFDTAVKSDPDLAAKLFPYLQEACVKSGSPSNFLILDAGGSDGSLINELKTLISQNKLNWKTQIFDVSSGDVRKIPIREQFGVVIAHELLDDIPLSVVEYDEDMTARTVLVDPDTGHEILGEPISQAESEWLHNWWPQTVAHARREIGITRDHAWSKLTQVFQTGRAIAVDYSNSREQRSLGTFDAGTLTGFQRGKSVRPIPNGTVNITAHVALDSCAYAASAVRPDITATQFIESPSDVNDFSWLIQDLRLQQ